MADCSRGRRQVASSSAAEPIAPLPPVLPASASATAEVPIRHWPHPIDCGPNGTADSLRCALAYQSALLAEIKALLEQLVSAEEALAEKLTESAAEEDAAASSAEEDAAASSAEEDAAASSTEAAFPAETSANAPAPETRTE